MSDADLMARLDMFGYRVPVCAIKTWPARDRMKVEKWLVYRTRKDRTRGRPSMCPAFLERYEK